MNILQRAGKWIDKNKKGIAIGAATLINPALGVTVAGAVKAGSAVSGSRPAPVASAVAPALASPASTTVRVLGARTARNEAQQAAAAEPQVLGMPRKWAIAAGAAVVAVVLVLVFALRPRRAAAA